MAYELLKKRLAKQEIEWLKETYGAAFSAMFDQWTNKLCEKAVGGGEIEDAADLERIVDDLFNEKMPSDLRHSWSQAKASGWLDRAKALLAVIRNRRPPWRTRVVERHDLPGVAGQRKPVAVRMYLSIDDVNKRVIIRAVDQLES